AGKQPLRRQIVDDIPGIQLEHPDIELDREGRLLVRIHKGGSSSQEQKEEQKASENAFLTDLLLQAVWCIALHCSLAGNHLAAPPVYPHHCSSILYAEFVPA